MELSKHSAVQIVQEINSVLPQKINLMNKHGIIIASTDPNRIGTFHEAAAKIITENLDELRIYPDSGFTGTLPGTNFLLRVYGESIGVLGITGPYEEILSIARVIKKMTEILVKEQDLQHRHELIESSRARFLIEWLTHNETFVNKSFLERGMKLNIDLRLPRRILAIDLRSDLPDFDRNNAEEILEHQLKSLDYHSLLCKTMTEIIVLVSIADTDLLREFAQHLKDTVEKLIPVQVTIGIDNPAADYLHAHTAYLQAQKALQSCLRMQKTTIKFYDEINMEIFADEVPDTTKLQYIKKIFCDYDNPELQDAIHLLELFYEHDGSISKTAARLFIHKNTLQQHLKKIAARTGYDPRSLRDTAVFYIVIYFYHDLLNNGYKV